MLLICSIEINSIGIKLSILKLELEILSKENIGLIKNDLPIFLSETIQEVRMISRSQSSDFVLENGIVTELSQLVRKLKLLKEIDFQIEINCDLRQFNNEFQIHLYRIIQELINNTIKHSNANLIELKITDSKEELFVKYIDNGNNVDEKEGTGSGIKNIITRVSLYNGNLIANNILKKGFNFNCVFTKNKIN